MRAPDEVAAMVRLKALGWGVRRIAVELGCSHMTVRRYLEAGGWIAYRRPQRATRLAGLEAWLAERFRRHRGNADVVRQELEREHGITVSLRTVERAVQERRRELVAEAKATVRFETPPGRQLQIDFGSTTVVIAGEPERVFLFVATLGFSRRGIVAAFRHERQSAWLDGLEGAFQHCGGVPEELLRDNATALVTQHDPHTRAVGFNDRAKVTKTGIKTCVPRGCYGNELLTSEFNPDEPGKYQLKNYAQGVGNVRVGWTGKNEDTKETLVLVKINRLGSKAMAQARAAARKLEASAYARKKVYGETLPLEGG